MDTRARESLVRGLRLPARAAVAVLAAAAWAVPASASKSANFSNVRSSFNDGGGRKDSLSHSIVDSVADVGQASQWSATFAMRTGLMPVYFYPGKVTGLAAAPGPWPGTISLTWTDPGNDGYAPGTHASAMLVRLSTSPGQAPSLSETFFWLAEDAQPPPPPPWFQGSTETFSATQLAAGDSYYIAVRGVEADGLPGVLSDGVTAYAKIVAPGVLAITFTGVTTSSFTVNWASGTAAAGYNPLRTKYLVDVSTRADFAGPVLSSVTVGISSVFQGLDANTTYYARSKAFGSAASSGPVLLDDISTLSDAVLGATLLCSGLSTTAAAGWTAMPLAPSSVTAEGFVFEASTDTRFTTIIASVTTNRRAVRLELGGLDPAATYYFRLGSLNWGSVPNYVTVSGGRSIDLTGFTGWTGFKTAELRWDAPSPDTSCRILGYRLYRSTEPPLPYAFRDATSATRYSDASVLVGTSYYYQLTADVGGGVETPAPNTVLIYIHSAPPLAPFGFDIAATTSQATLSWVPVPAFDNGTRFGAYAAPAYDELTAYDIWRSTRVTGAPWRHIGAVSSTTWRFVDPDSDAGYYYRLTAHNVTDTSQRSMVRGYDHRAYFVLPDELSSMEVSPQLAAPLIGDGVTPATAFLVKTSSHPEDFKGNVVQSVSLEPYQEGLQERDKMTLSGLGRLALRYDVVNDGVVPAGTAGTAASAASAAGSPRRPTPDDLSVYWNNGSKWVQLYGKLDEANQVVLLDAKYFGKYQLRAVERTGAFTFDTAGLSNRFITPNGDGKNDNVVFTFENQRDSEVKGSIYDLKGAFVSDMGPGPTGNSLMWDGKARGAVVQSGVYIYQLRAEGKITNGTIVVIK